MDNLSFEDLIALLNSPPAMARTLRYIKERSCRAYPAFSNKYTKHMPAHVLEHDRNCFNCGQDAPEHLGKCWGNNSCEIWVCATCVPQVDEALAQEKAPDRAPQPGPAVN